MVDGRRFETRLLVTKAVPPLTLRAVAAGPIALLAEATVVARLPVLALGIRIGAPLLIAVRAFGPLDLTVVLLDECRAIEIGLRLLSAVASLPVALLRRGKLGLGKLRGLRSALKGRGETVRQCDEIVILVAVVDLFAVPRITHLYLLLRGLGRGDDAEIVLGMLQIIFGHHWIAGRLGVARQLEVFFGDMLGRAANFDVGAVGFIGPR